MLKLSSDPPITGGANASRFPLSALTHFYALSSLHAQSSSRRSVPNVPKPGFSPVHKSTGLVCVTAAPVSVSPNTCLKQIGSKEACLLPAPVSAAPARINRHAAKAVCEGFGDPSRVFRRVCVCSWRPALYVLTKSHKAGRRACETPRLSPGCMPSKHFCPRKCIGLFASFARNIITSHTRNCNHIAYKPFFAIPRYHFNKEPHACIYSAFSQQDRCP